MTNSDFIPTARELQTLQQMRADYERKTREYRRFSDLYGFRRYSQSFGQHWFDENTMRSFSSKIGAIYHGQSPADWNIFVSSEHDRYSTTPRRYTAASD